MPDLDEKYWERLLAVEDKLNTLIELMLTPELPKKIKSKGLRRRVPPIGSAATAQRARVGRAAKRHGMSYDTWVKSYGMVDKLPRSAVG